MKPVLLETARISTTGVGLNYNVVTQDVVIGAPVVTTVKVEDPGSQEPVEVHAGRLVLHPPRKLAVYSEQPVLKLGRSELSGTGMEFFLGEGEERLEVEGNVKGLFHAEALGASRALAGRRAGVAGDGDHVLDLLDLAQQPAELRQPVDLDRGQDGGDALRWAHLDLGPGDVQPLFRHHGGDVPQQPLAVVRLDQTTGARAETSAGAA